jgi:cell division septum initiation protein DivIVA
MASAARTRAVLSCGIVGLCAALAMLGAEAAFGQADGSSSRNPSATVPDEVKELWREYPLNPTPPPTAPPPPATRQQSAEPGSSPAAEPEAFPFAITVAVGVAAVALVALALLVRLRSVWAPELQLAKRQPRTSPARRPTRHWRPTEGGVHRRFEATAEPPILGPDDDRASDVEALPPQPKQDKLELDSTDAGERSDVVKIARSATPEEGASNESYAQVGEQVASVLAAAQQAAEEIRATALEEAEGVLNEAKADVYSTRDEAERTAQELRRESEALRADADEYSRETREAADRYVATMRQQVEDQVAERWAEAEHQAREIEHAAEQRARDIETQALERRKAIVEEAARFEGRLGQLLGVYRGMTSQLEELLDTERAADAADDRREDNAADELADDLRPRPSRAESPRAGESGSPA